MVKPGAACKKLVDIEVAQELMSSDSKGSNYDVPVHMTGFAVMDPIKVSTGFHSASGYELTSRAKQQDKRTRDRARATPRHTFSFGDNSEMKRDGHYYGGF